MRKIITSIVLTACVALCAAVWPRSAEVGDLPTEPIKAAITAGIEAESEEAPLLIISADNNASEPEPITEAEPIKQTAPATADSPEVSPSVKPSANPISPPASTTTEPKPGTIAIIDGVKSMWIPGFGWVKDEGENVGTTVGNPGDQLTGNKVGIMGGDDSRTPKANPPQPELPDLTGDVIYIELQPPVTKDSTPPDYKPGQ